MNTITYDLRGILGVELVDASEPDIRALDRQLGPIRGGLPSGPLIRIRFVDRLEHGPLRLTGIRESGHDGTRFVVLRSVHKVPARVAVSVLDVGASIEIVAERAVPAVPLLIPIINLTALATGVVAVHAAAFVHEGRGILVTGWSKGGKTETLLAFLRHGASYVGDEWIYVRPDGTMEGIPEPIRLWQWHLDQLDQVRSRLPGTDRVRLGALSAAGHALRLAGRRVGPARRAASAVAGQRYADVAPHRILGPGSIARGPVPIDAVVFVGSTTSPAVNVRTTSATDVVDRVVHSLAYERRELVARAWEQRFAEPGRRSALLDDALRLERHALMAALGDCPVLALDHPYPVDIDSLYRTLAPALAMGS